MSCCGEGTAATPSFQRCWLCGGLEHGSLACSAVGGSIEWETPPPVNVTYRILDGRLFLVDPGSPPRGEDDV